MNLPQIKTVDVLGVPVACVNREELFRTAFDWTAQPRHRTICYANAHVLNTAFQDPQLLNILCRSDLVYADGISVVWASRYLYNIHIQKLTARAWFQEFAALAVQKNVKIYLLGGMEDVSLRASVWLKKSYPGIEVAGFDKGVFTYEQEPVIVQRINQAKPDILFVGLGSPLQEKWIERNRQELQIPICWAIGALFDYLAGSEKPVPKWMDQLGLEWFWRLWVNPKGKWVRYLFGNPLFLSRVWRQKRKLGKI